MTNSSPIEMISLEKLVQENHVYRKIKDLVNFSIMLKNLKDIEKEEGAKGYGIDRGIIQQSHNSKKSFGLIMTDVDDFCA